MLALEEFGEPIPDEDGEKSFGDDERGLPILAVCFFLIRKARGMFEVDDPVE